MTLLRKPSLAEIYTPIQKDMEAFSLRLKKELGSEDALIRDIHEHILKMVGKSLRPALVFFGSRLKAKTHPDCVPLAVAVELIHTATLVHDDIIDDSDLRRNQPSVHSKWGKEISIVAGDYLYAKAFLLLAGLADTKINQAFASCAHIMCEGEMKQIEKRTDFLMSEEAYLKIIHQKTAALFQAACAGGAYYSGINLSLVEKMSHYGYCLGMAFQIVDDCLDLVGDAQSLGKSAGLDVYKNDVTLPLLYLFRDLNPKDREHLLTALKDDGQAAFGKVKEALIAHRSIEKAMIKARSFTDQAADDLKDLPDSESKQSLAALVAYSIERVR